MDAGQFDAIARAVGGGGSRRRLLAMAGAAIGALGVRLGDGSAAAACKLPGARCQEKGKGGDDCCAGSRCRGKRCRCKKGWASCVDGQPCRRLATDASNCGVCGNVCASGCCANGQCRSTCGIGGPCCADCYADALGPGQSTDAGTEFCCPQNKVCGSGTADPTDDFCCRPEEACVKGQCCCDGCNGTKVCGKRCCAAAACCDGKCCPAGQVCARPRKNEPRRCVKANRSCASAGDCYGNEECRGGACCAGDRMCVDGSTPICCPAGEYCDLGIAGGNKCCPVGKSCGTSKKVRIPV